MTGTDQVNLDITLLDFVYDILNGEIVLANKDVLTYTMNFVEGNRSFFLVDTIDHKTLNGYDLPLIKLIFRISTKVAHS